MTFFLTLLREGNEMNFNPSRNKVKKYQETQFPTRVFWFSFATEVARRAGELMER